MKKNLAVVVTVICAVASMGWARDPFEVRLTLQADPTESDDGQLAPAMGVGYALTDGLLAGLYGGVVFSDRKLPVRSDRTYSMGLFFEQDLSVGYTLMPYVGGSVGLLDSTGPADETLSYLTGSMGLRYQVQRSVALSLAGTFHWAEKDIFDHKDDWTTGEWTADDTDFTVDIGLRFSF